MSWYDFFSRFYDRSLEPLYASTRVEAANALDLSAGQTVLDLPCGTGQSFDVLAPAVGETGRIIGVDLSSGMLQRAAARVEREGWTQVRLVEASAYEIDAERLADATEGRPIDRLHVFLGLTALERYDEAFARMWDLLAPGGRCVIVDVHAAAPTFQGRMVNLVARADIRREVWTVLERRADDYQRRELPSRREHGGTLLLASGRKPA
jgi:ubiquinone/menaquinone biosynthesis C-methylase UbiE